MNSEEVDAMNRRSYGYLVRALNELASLVARCGSKDRHHPVAQKFQSEWTAYRGNPVHSADARPESSVT